MSDQIICDCDNRFNVFDSKPYPRQMSCIVCRKVWRIGCSGRRLYSDRPCRSMDRTSAYEADNVSSTLTEDMPQ